MNIFNSVSLISNKYKKLGALIVIATVFLYLTLVLTNILNSTEQTFKSVLLNFRFENQTDLYVRIIRGCFLVGLLILVLSKERIEDEWVVSTRINSFWNTFLIVIFGLIGYSFVGPIDNFKISANEWLNISLILYFINLNINFRSKAK